jgi:molybdate transport system regulatory protein
VSPNRSERIAGSGPLQVRSKVWLERDGEVVISDFRADLLLAIAETGSVASAAMRLELPYRTAWKKLRRMEEAAGVALLASDSGGSDGGGSELTPAARELLDAFQRLNRPVSELLEVSFTREGPAITASLDAALES